MELYANMRSTCFDAQVFSAWMHLCAIRLYTESVLRYGLPPKFLVRNNSDIATFSTWVVLHNDDPYYVLTLSMQAAVLAPSTKTEKKVRAVCDKLCNERNR